MRVRILALAVALFAVFFVAAYIASTSRGYLDVSDLKGLRGGSVNVMGVIGGYRVEGDTLVVTLVGRDGSKVTLVMPLELFTSAHGKPPGPWILGKSIGVRGYYKPSAEGGESLGVLEVKDILNPCHESYKAPPART